MEPLVLYDSTRAENPAINLYEHDNKTCGSIQSHHAIQIIGEYTGRLKLRYSLDNIHWGILYSYPAPGEYLDGQTWYPNTVWVFPAVPAYVKVDANDVTTSSLKVLLI